MAEILRLVRIGDFRSRTLHARTIEAACKEKIEPVLAVPRLRRQRRKERLTEELSEGTKAPDQDEPIRDSENESTDEGEL
jgi:hypothetical protein